MHERDEQDDKSLPLLGVEEVLFKRKVCEALYAGSSPVFSPLSLFNILRSREEGPPTAS